MNATKSKPIPAKPLPAYLRQRHRAWKETGYADNQAWFQRLADKGQSPRAMVIGCCDSRVDIVQLFGGEPGDLFVLRNVASLVPPHSPDPNHHGTSAAVEYAVTGLKVAHLVVVGHSNCGGIKACHDLCSGNGESAIDATHYISNWVSILEPGFARLSDGAKGNVGLPDLEQAGVCVSLENLMSFPFVAEAVARGDLTLHGCWIDISTGDLQVFDPESGSFR